MTRPDLAAIRRRWSTDGGMGNDRSADDYTDAGCRILAEHAFRDVPALLTEVERLTAGDARVARLCEGGCGCRYGTTDPDRRDCGCGGPCTTALPGEWGCDPALGGCGSDCPTCPEGG